jgi:hypothetical protein
VGVAPRADKTDRGAPRAKRGRLRGGGPTREARSLRGGGPVVPPGRVVRGKPGLTLGLRDQGSGIAGAA